MADRMNFQDDYTTEYFEQEYNQTDMDLENPTDQGGDYTVDEPDNQTDMDLENPTDQGEDYTVDEPNNQTDMDLENPTDQGGDYTVDEPDNQTDMDMEDPTDEGGDYTVDEPNNQTDMDMEDPTDEGEDYTVDEPNNQTDMDMEDPTDEGGETPTVDEPDNAEQGAENAGFDISGAGAEPIENPNIPADTNDGDDIAKLDFSSQYTDPNGVGTRTFTGADGANTFQAEALLNAKPEIIAEYTNDDGSVDWRGVAGENDNYHDHWIEGPGDIVINDFGKGDKFVLRGHTAEAILVEESEGVATVGLISDQGRDNSRGDGAHDLDVIGKATIYHDGSFNFGSDVRDISNNVFDGVAIENPTDEGEDSTADESDNQTDMDMEMEMEMKMDMDMEDPTDEGEDYTVDEPNNQTDMDMENPTDQGGETPMLDEPNNAEQSAENGDFDISSTGAEPIENPNIPADTNDGDDIAKLDFSSQYTDPNGVGTKTLSGTDGANTFQAEALLNAKPEIIAEYTNNDGSVDWRGVAGENDNYHDHWIEGPGDIVINNFGEGDKFVLRGHTAEAILIDELEGVATIGLISDQGRDNSRGDGAHDLDVIGKATIHHDGSFNFGSDVRDISNNVFDGVI